MLTWGSFSGGEGRSVTENISGCESCDFSSLRYTLKLGIGPWQICQGWATYFFGLTHMAIPPPSPRAPRYLPRAIPRHGSQAGSKCFLYSRATVNNISWDKSFKIKTLCSVCGERRSAPVQHLCNTVYKKTIMNLYNACLVFESCACILCMPALLWG